MSSDLSFAGGAQRVMSEATGVEAGLWGGGEWGSDTGNCQRGDEVEIGVEGEMNGEQTGWGMRAAAGCYESKVEGYRVTGG